MGSGACKKKSIWLSSTAWPTVRNATLRKTVHGPFYMRQVGAWLERRFDHVSRLLLLLGGCSVLCAMSGVSECARSIRLAGNWVLQSMKNYVLYP